MSKKWVEDFPPLPVPELSQSCEKYLKSVKPFLNDEEYRHTEFIVNTFRSGVGKLLQEKLKKRASTKTNWLIDWWKDGYAAFRGSLPYHSNVAGCTVMTPQNGRSLISHAAYLAHFLTQKHLLIQNKRWPQTFLRKEAPLNMLLYHGLFATSRMPDLEKDIILNYSLKDGQPSLEMHHIVVIKQRRFYTFDILTPDLEVLTPSEIERQFHRITAMAESKSHGPGVGALTSTDRRSWKKVQDYLFSLDENNRDIVDIINKSIYVLVFDEEEPTSTSEASYAASMGDCKNRWYDKGTQVLTFKNGCVGNHHDHAHMDGFMLVDIFKSALEDLDDPNGQSKVSSKTRFLSQPVELEFSVDDRIMSEIEAAEQKHDALKAKYCCVDEVSTNFGKKFTKDHSIHPDALVQMAIQLAYYYLHKRFAATYETATTRKFHDGRTETVRSCSVESQRFVLAMCDSNSSMTKKVSLFREAIENQKNMMDECCDGQGIDRHFLGLKILSQQEGMELPEIFKDKAWKLSGGDGNFPLSTSLSGYSNTHGGMGPITEDGYGVYYTIENERFQIMVSSFGTPGTDAAGMWKALDKALCDVRDLLLHPRL